MLWKLWIYNMTYYFADGILLGGILIMYEFHKFLRFILLLVHSFWIPQIVINVVRDSRKPLHPHYILGMTITRLAIPLYIFGCPHNFMRTKPDKNWCICLGVFMGLQATILLLQHYLGSRCFIPHQVWCDWCLNHALICKISLLSSPLLSYIFWTLRLSSTLFNSIKCRMPTTNAHAHIIPIWLLC